MLGNPGMATIKEVARKAGVSVGTVSNVLSKLPTVSPDLRNRVEKAIAQLRFRPNQVARSLKQQRTRTLGLVISDITNPFFPGIVRGAEDAAAERGYVLSVFNTDDRLEREKQVLYTLEERRVDGVLLVPALARQDDAHVAHLIGCGTPVVTIDREIDGAALAGLALDGVVVDNRGSVAAAVAYLHARGARRVAYLGGPRNFYIAKERRAGFDLALKRAGRKPEAKLVWTGDFRAESGYRAVLDHYPGTKPDALFVANVLMTLGAVKAIGELGLQMPDQLQLVTFDHLSILDNFHPRPTAVAQPSYDMGKEAVRLMLERLDARTAPARRVVLPTELIPGETSYRDPLP